MKNFVVFLLLFVSSLLALDRSMGWVLDYVYERITVGQKGGRINAYLQQAQAPPLLLMGNSRLACNVNPDSLPLGAYSIAHDGTRQVFQTGLLNLLQQKHKLPAAIVLHVDLEEFNNPDHLEDILNLKHYYGQAPYITAYHNMLSPFEHLKFWSSLYRHNGLLFSLAKNTYLQRTAAGPNEGYEPTPPSERDSTRTLYSASLLGQKPVQLNRGQLRYLQDFVALCKANNIRLLCFTSSYYRTPRWVPAASSLVDSLLRAERVPYVNLALNPSSKLTSSPRYWRDATHLNTLGIPLFSQILAQHVQEFANPVETGATLIATDLVTNEKSINLTRQVKELEP